MPKNAYGGGGKKKIPSELRKPSKFNKGSAKSTKKTADNSKLTKMHKAGGKMLRGVKRGR